MGKKKKAAQTLPTAEQPNQYITEFEAFFTKLTRLHEAHCNYLPPNMEKYQSKKSDSKPKPLDILELDVLHSSCADISEPLRDLIIDLRTPGMTEKYGLSVKQLSGMKNKLYYCFEYHLLGTYHLYQRWVDAGNLQKAQNHLSAARSRLNTLRRECASNGIIAASKKQRDPNNPNRERINLDEFDELLKKEETKLATVLKNRTLLEQSLPIYVNRIKTALTQAEPSPRQSLSRYTTVETSDSLFNFLLKFDPQFIEALVSECIERLQPLDMELLSKTIPIWVNLQKKFTTEHADEPTQRIGAQFATMGALCNEYIIKGIHNSLEIEAEEWTVNANDAQSLPHTGQEEDPKVQQTLDALFPELLQLFNLNESEEFLPISPHKPIEVDTAIRCVARHRTQLPINLQLAFHEGFLTRIVNYSSPRFEATKTTPEAGYILNNKLSFYSFILQDYLRIITVPRPQIDALGEIIERHFWTIQLKYFETIHNFTSQNLFRLKEHLDQSTDDDIDPQLSMSLEDHNAPTAEPSSKTKDTPSHASTFTLAVYQKSEVIYQKYQTQLELIRPILDHIINNGFSTENPFKLPEEFRERLNGCVYGYLRYEIYFAYSMANIYFRLGDLLKAETLYTRAYDSANLLDVMCLTLHPSHILIQSKAVCETLNFVPKSFVPSEVFPIFTNHLYKTKNFCKEIIQSYETQHTSVASLLKLDPEKIDFEIKHTFNKHVNLTGSMLSIKYPCSMGRILSQLNRAIETKNPAEINRILRSLSMWFKVLDTLTPSELIQKAQKAIANTIGLCTHALATLALSPSLDVAVSMADARTLIAQLKSSHEPDPTLVAKALTESAQPLALLHALCIVLREHTSEYDRSRANVQTLLPLAKRQYRATKAIYHYLHHLSDIEDIEPFKAEITILHFTVMQQRMLMEPPKEANSCDDLSASAAREHFNTVVKPLIDEYNDLYPVIKKQCDLILDDPSHLVDLLEPTFEQYYDTLHYILYSHQNILLTLGGVYFKHGNLQEATAYTAEAYRMLNWLSENTKEKQVLKDSQLTSTQAGYYPPAVKIQLLSNQIKSNHSTFPVCLEKEQKLHDSLKRFVTTSLQSAITAYGTTTPSRNPKRATRADYLAITWKEALSEGSKYDLAPLIQETERALNEKDAALLPRILVKWRQVLTVFNMQHPDALMTAFKANVEKTLNTIQRALDGKSNVVEKQPELSTAAIEKLAAQIEGTPKKRKKKKKSAQSAGTDQSPGAGASTESSSDKVSPTASPDVTVSEITPEAALTDALSQLKIDMPATETSKVHQKKKKATQAKQADGMSSNISTTPPSSVPSTHATAIETTASVSPLPNPAPTYAWTKPPMNTAPSFHDDLPASAAPDADNGDWTVKEVRRKSTPQPRVASTSTSKEKGAARSKTGQSKPKATAKNTKLVDHVTKALNKISLSETKPSVAPPTMKPASDFNATSKGTTASPWMQALLGTAKEKKQEPPKTSHTTEPVVTAPIAPLTQSEASPLKDGALPDAVLTDEALPEPSSPDALSAREVLVQTPVDDEKKPVLDHSNPNSNPTSSVTSPVVSLDSDTVVKQFEHISSPQIGSNASQTPQIADLTSPECVSPVPQQAAPPVQNPHPLRSTNTPVAAIPVPGTVQQLMYSLEQAGYFVYIFGGFPRDILLNLMPNDVDLITNCPSEVLKTHFPQGKISKNCVGLFRLKPINYKLLTDSIADADVHYFNTMPLDFTSIETAPGEEQQAIIKKLQSLALTIDTYCVDRLGQVYDLLNHFKDLHATTLATVNQSKNRFDDNADLMVRVLTQACRFGKQISDFEFNNIHLINELTTLPFDIYKQKIAKMFDPYYAYNMFSLLLRTAKLHCLLPNSVETSQYISNAAMLYNFPLFYTHQTSTFNQPDKMHTTLPNTVIALLLLPLAVQGSPAGIPGLVERFLKGFNLEKTVPHEYPLTKQNLETTLLIYYATITEYQQYRRQPTHTNQAEQTSSDTDTKTYTPGFSGGSSSHPSAATHSPTRSPHVHNRAHPKMDSTKRVVKSYTQSTKK